METPPDEMALIDHVFDEVFNQIVQRLEDLPRIRVVMAQRPFILIRRYQNCKSFNRTKILVGPTPLQRSRTGQWHWVYSDGQEYNAWIDTIGMGQSSHQFNLGDPRVIDQIIDWILENTVKRRKRRRA